MDDQQPATPERDGTPQNVTLGTPLVCSCCGNGTFLPRDKFMNYRDIPNLMDASMQRGDAYGHGENSDRPTHGEIMWALSQPRNSLVRKLAEALDNTAVVQSESAWIVEMKTGFGYGNYWGPDGYIQWVPIDKAVRFSRKEDAERVIVMLHAQAARDGHKRPLPIEATEHEWVTP